MPRSDPRVDEDSDSQSEPRQHSVGPRTRSQYQAAVQALLARTSLGQASTPRQVDVALNRYLKHLFRTSPSAGPARHVYYGTRWHYSLNNVLLRRSFQSLKGFERKFRSLCRDPVCWEDVLLTALTLVDPPMQNTTPRELFMTVVAMLLSFDLYARGQDLLQVPRSEVRPPTSSTATSASFWSITFFPQSQGKPGKDQLFDHCKLVGSTNSHRRWLGSMCALLSRTPPVGTQLITLSQARLRALMAEARAHAGLPPATPHQFRHGGASMDGMAGVADSEMMPRGGWKSLSALTRYRRPAKYARCVGNLSPTQLARAHGAPHRLLGRLQSLLVQL